MVTATMKSQNPQWTSCSCEIVVATGKALGIVPLTSTGARNSAGGNMNRKSNGQVIQYIVTMDRGHTQYLSDIIREIAYYIPRAHRARIRRLAIQADRCLNGNDYGYTNRWLQSPTNDFEFPRWFNEMRPRRRIKKRW